MSFANDLSSGEQSIIDLFYRVWPQLPIRHRPVGSREESQSLASSLHTYLPQVGENVSFSYHEFMNALERYINRQGPPFWSQQTRKSMKDYVERVLVWGRGNPFKTPTLAMNLVWRHMQLVDGSIDTTVSKYADKCVNDWQGFSNAFNAAEKSVIKRTVQDPIADTSSWHALRDKLRIADKSDPAGNVDDARSMLDLCLGRIAGKIEARRAAGDPDSFDIEDWILQHDAPGHDDETVLFHTHGMYTFDRPEVEVLGPRSNARILRHAVRDWAEYLAVQDTMMEDGHTFSWGEDYSGRFVVWSDERTDNHYFNDAIEIVDLRREDEQVSADEVTRSQALAHLQSQTGSETETSHIRQETEDVRRRARAAWWEQIDVLLRRATDRIRDESALTELLNCVYIPDIPAIRTRPSDELAALIQQRASVIMAAREALLDDDFNVDNWVTIERHSIESAGSWWLHTLGLFLFNFPEFEVLGVSSADLRQMSTLLSGLAGAILESALQDEEPPRDMLANTASEIIGAEVSLSMRPRQDHQSLAYYGTGCLNLASVRTPSTELVSKVISEEQRRKLLQQRAEEHRPHFHRYEWDIFDGSGTQPASAVGRARPGVSSDRVYQQTLYDLLRMKDNDYSEAEASFQAGLVRLVDLPDTGADTDTLHQKESHSLVDSYLKQDTYACDSVSIIIPVRGRNRELAECLRSLLRQRIVLECPIQIELILVEDGPLDGRSSSMTNTVRHLVSQLPYARVLTLRKNRGRATARNVGLWHASGRIVVFIDSSMVLHEHFLLEFMMRHERTQGIALLGFKENVTWNQLAKMRDRLRAGTVKPDYREDWKYRHTLGPMEGGFRYRGHWYDEGSEIQYMALTNWLRQLSGTEQIGYRSLPTFFQTNIASAPREVLLDSGGFDVAFDDSLWGLEDSFIGALLVARGIKLVPCPSALAFKIEHPEGEAKWFELDRHRRLYSELLLRPVAEFRGQRLRNLIESLRADGVLIER